MGLFRVKTDIGEIVLNGYIAVLQKDMEVLADWSDVQNAYEDGVLDIIIDYSICFSCDNVYKIIILV